VSDSSTSNSDPSSVATAPPAPAPAAEPALAPPNQAAPARPRLPKAFLLALLLLGLVELAIRLLPLRVTLPYERRGDALEAVTVYADRGSTDVALTGSSMMRDALSPNIIQGDLEKAGIRATVGNFAVRGAKAEEMRIIVQRLLRSRHKPKVVIIGIAPMDLVDVPPNYARQAAYWRLGEWWRAWRRAANDNDPATSPDAIRARLPHAVYNQIAAYYYTLRCRDRLASFIRDPRGVDLRPETDPVIGTPGRPRESRVAMGLIKTKHVEKYLNRTLPNGKFNYGIRLRGEIRDTLRACRAAKVKAVVMEMPLSRVMRSCIPRARYLHFLEVARALAHDGGARFMTIKEVQFSMRDEYFYDAQHLNLPGCRRFSHVITTNCLEPLMKKETGGEARTTTTTTTTTTMGAR
jgi:hypothetical protein